MSAPATSHDLRCPAPAGDCNCRRASVLRLPVGNVRDCVMCGGLPYWLIQSGDRREDRSCRACLDPALDDICSRSDGFLPVTVRPIRIGGAA